MFGTLDSTEVGRSKNKVGAAIWAIIAACGCYFCMYMFRKPFTAAMFIDQSYWGIGYKPLLLIAQVFGYTLSKFVGIRVVAEATREKRVAMIVSLIATSEVALVLFGLTPKPWNILWLFVNGLPLGMVFGLVLAFLEGRRQTEFLAAGLCASFVFADGIAKTVGTRIIESGITEVWMPAISGACFLPLTLIFCWMLTRIPNPDEADRNARSDRTPMTKDDQRQLYRRFAFGLTMLLVCYGLIGILRGVRGDFSPEIWAAMQTKVEASAFSRVEFWAGGGALLIFSVLSTLKSNRTGFFVGIGLAIVGCLVVAAALLLRQMNMISPFVFMAMTGFGLYLPYFAVHTTIFERLIALTRERGNIGYLMYLADAFSYAGYVVVMLARNFMKPGPENFLPFFTDLCWSVVVAGIFTLVLAALYFQQKEPKPSPS
jgi:hypothetical protein